MERIDTTADPVHEALTLQIELEDHGDDNRILERLKNLASFVMDHRFTEN